MRSRRVLAFLLAFMMVITMIPQSTLNAKSKKKQKSHKVKVTYTYESGKKVAKSTVKKFKAGKSVKQVVKIPVKKGYTAKIKDKDLKAAKKKGATVTLKKDKLTYTIKSIKKGIKIKVTYVKNKAPAAPETTEAEPTTAPAEPTVPAITPEEEGTTAAPAEEETTAAPAEEEATTAPAEEGTTAAPAEEETTQEQDNKPVDSITANSETVKVTVSFDDKEPLPEGAVLKIDEVFKDGQERAERNERLAKALFKKYGNVKISDVRYLSIRIMADGTEYEPQYPVSMKAEYKDALSTDDPQEYEFNEEFTPEDVKEHENHFVAVHYAKDGTQVYDANVTTKKTNKGITESVITTDSFSDYDLAYIYEYETIEQTDDYQPSAIGDYLSAKDIPKMLAAGRNNLTKGAGDTPAHNKELIDNENGTYTLGLSVTGDADTTNNTASNANVIIVTDTSNSMVNYYVPMALGARGSDDPSGYPSYDLYRLNGNNRYIRADDGYEGDVYARSYGNNYSLYTGQRYSRTIRREDAAEKVIYDFTHALYAYQNQEDPTNIQTALITFNANANTLVPWTSTESDITGKVSSTGAGGSKKLTNSSGTNWEAALRAAQTLMNDESTDSDPTFVVFITDGAPSQVVGTPAGTYLDADEAYPPAKDEARDIQQACAATGTDSHGAFFGIYAYGKETDYLASLMYYAYNGTEHNPEGQTFETEGYFNAGDSEALAAAMSEIFQKIVNTLGVGSATITDGTTSDVVTTTGAIADLLDINESSYQYWLSWPVQASGSGRYTFEMKDPSTAEVITYTATVSGGTVTIQWTSDGIAKTATYPGSISSGNVLTVEWTRSTAFYAMSPNAAYYNSSSKAVIWNPIGTSTLLDGVTYEVTFEVYPSQYTMDLIADLKNNTVTYESLDANIKKYLLKDEDGDDYTLLTNTEASLTYTDTRTDDGQQTTSYTNPDPVGTSAAQQVAVAKDWSNTLDDDMSYKPDSMALYIARDGAKRYEIVLSDNNHWQGLAWISYGLLTVDSVDGEDVVTIKTEGHDFNFMELDEVEYYWEIEAPTVRPMIINNEETLLSLLKASEVPAELSSITTDNGRVTVNETIEGETVETQYYKLTIGDKVEYYKVVDNTDVHLKAENHRRSYLDVVKTLKEGTALSKDVEFPISMKVVNSLEAKGKANNPNSDYYVWFSIFENGAALKDATLVTADATIGYQITNGTDKACVTDLTNLPEGYSFNGYFYVPSGTTITVPMKTSYNLRFLNLPAESTYMVSETLTDAQLAAKYEFDSIAAIRGYNEVKESATGTTKTWKEDATGTVNGQTIEGTIEYTESAYKVTVTNNCKAFYVYHSGVAGDGNLETILMADLPESGKYDLTKNLTSGTLYGGYYLDYSGKGTYKDDGIKGRDGVKYKGGRNIWSGNDAVLAEPGNAITPTAGETYYIKEVPDTYLNGHTHGIYYYNHVNSPDANNNNLTKIHLFTSTDDLLYNGVGFTVGSSDKPLSRLYDSVSYTKHKNNTVDQNSYAYTVVDDYKLSGYVVKQLFANTITDGYVGYYKYMEKQPSITENASVTYTPYWITPDGLKVTRETVTSVYTPRNGAGDPGAYSMDTSSVDHRTITNTN